VHDDLGRRKVGRTVGVEVDDVVAEEAQLQHASAREPART